MIAAYGAVGAFW